MQIKLRRYRWLFLIACLAAAASMIGWLQLSGYRSLRERYDRVRLGMTPAEVAAVMDGPLRGNCWDQITSDWDTLSEGSAPMIDKRSSGPGRWVDESACVFVSYYDGKTTFKCINTRVPPWKVKARKCLAWLRGLVAW